MVLTIAVLLLLFGKIYVKAMIIGEGYRIEEMRQSALTKDAELRALRLNLASASRPDVLTQRARSFGLRPALPQQLRRIQG
jgi:cell division protein FtsL